MTSTTRYYVYADGKRQHIDYGGLVGACAEARICALRNAGVQYSVERDSGKGPLVLEATYGVVGGRLKAWMR